MPTSKKSRPLLLDTHCFYWLQLGEQEFSPDSLAEIREASRNQALLVSVISIWELGMLEAKKRIRLQMPLEEWVKEALATPGLLVNSLAPSRRAVATRIRSTG